MANIFESAFMTLKNGMTMYFADSKARGLIDRLKALVDTKYGPDNPPPSTAGKIWYATCSTAAGTGAKTATSSTGDFVLQTGAMVRLKCTTANTAANPTISIDGSTAKTIQPKSGTSGMAYRWRAQEVIDLVYDGSNFIMSLGPEADTSFYGITKLNSATNSTSTTEAATPSAVKDAYDLAYGRAKANENLLNNWYFVGGGSQQGAGYFPINSNGQTSYSGTGVTIDGWQKDSLSSIQVQANGVAFNGSGAISNAFQTLTNKVIYGKTVTASALETSGTLSVGTETVPTKPASGWSYKNIVAGSTYNLVFGVAADGTIRLFIQPKNSASIVLAAVKLELGDTQTLAHQVNGAWVLNEVPNYTDELVRCGAYTPTYQKGESVNLAGSILVGTKLSSGIVVCSIVLPKAVPSTLTITNSLTVGWVRGNGTADSSGLAVASVTRSTDNVLQIGVSGSTIATLQAAVVNISSGSISFS